MLWGAVSGCSARPAASSLSTARDMDAATAAGAATAATAAAAMTGAVAAWDGVGGGGGAAASGSGVVAGPVAAGVGASGVTVPEVAVESVARRGAGGGVCQRCVSVAAWASGGVSVVGTWASGGVSVVGAWPSGGVCQRSGVSDAVEAVAGLGDDISLPVAAVMKGLRFVCSTGPCVTSGAVDLATTCAVDEGCGLESVAAGPDPDSASRDAATAPPVTAATPSAPPAATAAVPAPAGAEASSELDDGGEAPALANGAMVRGKLSSSFGGGLRRIDLRTARPPTDGGIDLGRSPCAIMLCSRRLASSLARSSLDTSANMSTSVGGSSGGLMRSPVACRLNRLARRSSPT